MRLKLKQLMQERGISQSDVARGIGITAQSVNGWVDERTRDNKNGPFPDIHSIEALCLFFGVPLSGLLDITEAVTPSGKTYQDFRQLAVA
jgi:transcriptional regulator with XRE-family HTH domain